LKYAGPVLERFLSGLIKAGYQNIDAPVFQTANVAGISLHLPFTLVVGIIDRNYSATLEVEIGLNSALKKQLLQSG
jgi:hypothetical protein